MTEDSVARRMSLARDAVASHDLERAEVLYLGALELAKSEGLGSDVVMEALFGLAEALRPQLGSGDEPRDGLSEAVEVEQLILRLCETNEGRDSLAYARILLRLVEARREYPFGHRVGDETLSWARCGLEIVTSRCPTGSLEPVRYQHALAGSLSDLDQHREAVSVRRVALATVVEGLPFEHPETAVAYANLGSALLAEGVGLHEAADLFRTSIRSREQAGSPELSINARLNLAQCLLAAGQLDEALACAHEAYSLAELHYSFPSGPVFEASIVLEDCLRAKGHDEEATRLRSRFVYDASSN